MKTLLLVLKLSGLIFPMIRSSNNSTFKLKENGETIAIDNDFNEYNLDSIIINHPYTIVATKKSCRGCIEFIIQTETIENVIYLLENLSFTEIASCSKSFDKGNSNLFFTTESSLNNVVSINEISPLLISSDFNIITYEKLKEISGDFSKIDFIKKLP